MSEQLTFYPEPTLTFGHDQRIEDPRDGLTLFGPLDEGKPLGLRAAVVGTSSGIDLFRKWLRGIQGYLSDKGSQVARPSFPGFEEVFRIPWTRDPVLEIEIPNAELERNCNLNDPHQRVYSTVSAFANRILDATRREEIAADLWFVVIPDLVYTRCRPRSVVPANEQIEVKTRLKPHEARRLRVEPTLFPKMDEEAVPYYYDLDFHNQLKARLLGQRVVTQIVRESTIAPPGTMQGKRDMSNYQAAIAWNLTTAAFYKSGYRPWKIGGIRKGVCYLGLVFKRDERHADPRTACCAAQMFLDSGDGVVFRGAVGPWYSPDTEEFHLSRRNASKLITLALDSYAERHESPPGELFIHGQVFFSDEEWKGFAEAVDETKTQLVGIKIRGDSGLRLYRTGKRPVLRGTAYKRHDRAAYLWTRGYTPRLRTYPGREVPRPLTINISNGDADLDVVLTDIMALTKLNYNACIFADGVPVTLRFANAVGEILTAAPDVEKNPLPFKHYI